MAPSHSSCDIGKRLASIPHVYIPASEGFGLSCGSLALAEQVEAIDKDRLLEKKGTIESAEIMAELTKAIQIQIGVLEEHSCSE